MRGVISSEFFLFSGILLDILFIFEDSKGWDGCFLCWFFASLFFSLRFLKFRISKLFSESIISYFEITSKSSKLEDVCLINSSVGKVEMFSFFFL